MHVKKNWLLPKLLIIELCLFALFNIVGPQGFNHIWQLHIEAQNLNKTILELRDTINTLAQKEKVWHLYPFYQEQIAREQLQLIKPGDTLYFYTKYER